MSRKTALGLAVVGVVALTATFFLRRSSTQEVQQFPAEADLTRVGMQGEAGDLSLASAG